MDFLNDLFYLTLFQSPIYGIIMLSTNCFEDTRFKSSYMVKRSVYGIIIWVIIFLLALWKAPRPQCWIGLSQRELCFETAKMVIPLFVSFSVSLFTKTLAYDAERKAKYDVFCKFKREFEDLAEILNYLLNHKNTYDQAGIAQKINKLREASDGYLDWELDGLYNTIANKKMEEINWDKVEQEADFLFHHYYL